MPCQMSVLDLITLLERHPLSATVELFVLNCVICPITSVHRVEGRVRLFGDGLPGEGRIEIEGRPECVISPATADQGGSLDG